MYTVLRTMLNLNIVFHTEQVTDHVSLQECDFFTCPSCIKTKIKLLQIILEETHISMFASFN